MKRAILALFLCVALTGAKTPKPAPEHEPIKMECAPVGEMAKKLMTGPKLAYLADAIDMNDRVHMWYISRATGMWVEVEVTDNLQACIVRGGYDWHFATGK